METELLTLDELTERTGVSALVTRARRSATGVAVNVTTAATSMTSR